MNLLARFFIDNHKFTWILTLMMIVFGWGGLNELNTESFPRVNLAIAVITTVYPGASAEDIETKITKPIEDEVRTVTGLKEVKSTSQPGQSRVVARIDLDRYDVEKAMADLQRAVDRVSTLPIDLENRPSFLEVKSEEFPVVELAITGSNDGRRREIIADELKEYLEDNKNILSVRFDGFADRAFEVNLKKDQLLQEHIGFNEVIDSIAGRNVNTPAGHLREADNQELLRIEGKVSSAAELASVVVRSNFSGQQVRLGDIAEVRDGADEYEMRVRHNGAPATVLVITKKGGADTLELVADIEKRLELFRKKYNPDYQFTVFNSEGSRIGRKLDILISNAFAGLILVLLFLLVFLPGRAGFMASLSLPFAILITLGFMPIFNMNIDTITILALVISLGMLVDNSVVITENYVRLTGEGESAHNAVFTTIRELWLPITGTALTTIAAFLPMLVTTGVMGQFIKYIPMIVTISLLASLFESFFLLPVRLLYPVPLFSPLISSVQRILGRSRSIDAHARTQALDSVTDDWFDCHILPRFQSFMESMVRRRYSVLVAFTGLLALSIFLMTVVNQFELFPADQTEIYVARVETQKGSRLETTDQALAILAENVRRKTGRAFDHIVSRAGTTQVDPMDPKSKSGNSVGFLMMMASHETKMNTDPEEMLNELRTVEVPTIVSDIKFEAMVEGPPVGDPITASFRSNSMQPLSELLLRLKDEMSQVPGVRNMTIDDVIGDDEIFVTLDYALMARLGLDVARVGSTLRAAVAGRIVSDVNLNNKDVDLIVRLMEPDRQNLEDLKNIKIMDMRGNLIPLASIASFSRKPGAPQIKRFDYKRSKTLIGDVDENIITALEANAILLEKFKTLRDQYPDVTMVFGGEQENTQESLTSLFNALILSLIGIFALLVLLFQSYSRPLIIMSTIPLGLVGFSVAFAAQGRPISFMSLIGIIGLGGIIVNSGIVLISFIESLRQSSQDSQELLLAKASSLRLRAVVASSLTTISGLLPTAYGIGGSDPMLEPMTLAMAWGLTSGTLLTLIWVPCAYAMLEDLVKKPA